MIPKKPAPDLIRNGYRFSEKIMRKHKSEAGSRFSETRSRSGAAALKIRASVFAALGDETRLSVLVKLAKGRAQSISSLTAGTRLTRQGMTKHLRVLEGAGVVRSVRAGRESRFALEPKPIDDARVYLDRVSRQWDEALARLKAFVVE
jgi:DNA-binding transcriptional ArsR family regulator